MKSLKSIAVKKIKRYVKDKLITKEQEAVDIVKQFCPALEDYEVTGVIHPLLPKDIKEIISNNKYKHPWFKNKVNRIVYEDVWGRVWNKTTGIVKKSIKLFNLGPKHIWIDQLGGMSWTSKDGKHFICEFRTSREEFLNSRISPERFIG